MKRLTWEYKDGGMFVDGTEVKTFICDDVEVCTGNAILKLAKYEDLEDKLHSLCKNEDENIIENLINVFIETIFKGQKHEGFEILTNEDAILYNEWLKSR